MRNPLLHWGNYVTIRGFHFLDPLGGLGRATSQNQVAKAPSTLPAQVDLDSKQGSEDGQPDSTSPSQLVFTYNPYATIIQYMNDPSARKLALRFGV